MRNDQYRFQPDPCLALAGGRRLGRGRTALSTAHHEAGRKHGNTGERETETRNCRRHSDIGVGHVSIRMAARTTRTAVAMAIHTTLRTTTSEAVVLRARRLGTTLTSLVSSHTSTDSFRRHPGTDLDIGFLDDHSGLDLPTARSTVFCGKHPLAIGLRQSLDRDNTDTRLVVAAVTWAEPNTPSCLLPRQYISSKKTHDEITYPELHVAGLVLLHTLAGIHSILTVDHLDEGMALVDVDNASLDNTKLVEKRAQVGLRRTMKMLTKEQG